MRSSNHIAGPLASRPLPPEARAAQRRLAYAALLIFTVILATTPAARAQSVPLAILEERAFQQAAAKAEASIVRIETVGGLDVIGDAAAANGPTTGVIVGPEGWIITSTFNFASKPASILVTTGDGQRYPANLIAKDESRQLTLLKIAAEGLKPLEPVPANQVRVGQWSIALGRTLEPTFPNVSVGIVSAVNRISGKALQTDAKLSPVNYGGALVDLDGRGLGIIVPMSPDKDEVSAGVDWYDSGIGFAVPLVDLLAVLERLKQGETLKPGRLGILYPDKGLLTGEVKIDKVRPRSPAEAAGLQSSDVVIGLDGQVVDRAATLKQLLGPKYGGDTVTLKIRRGTETLEKNVTLVGEIPPFEIGFLGTLPERARKGEKPPATVRGILPGSPAEASGIQAGTIISKVGDRETATFDDVRTALQNQGAGDKVSLETSLNGVKAIVEITLSASPAAVASEIAPREIPSPTEDLKDTKVGRFFDTIEGDDRRFWAYVPEHYNPLYSYGLVVWLHPELDKREAATLDRWRTVCEKRGLILVAPPASNEAWGQGDVDYVLGVIAKMQQRYTIDSGRTVVFGEAEGARLALFLGLAKRDVLAGAATLDSALPSKMPEVDPDNPVRFHASVFEDGPRAASVEKSAEAMRKAKYPLIIRKWPGKNTDGPSLEMVDELGRWIDSLDGV